MSNDMKLKGKNYQETKILGVTEIYYISEELWKNFCINRSGYYFHLRTKK